MKAPISYVNISIYHLKLYRQHSNDQHVQKELKQLNEVRLTSNEILDFYAKNYLVETARPSSPSADQSRQEYRRGGYDKQGEVGAGSARPEFVS